MVSSQHVELGSLWRDQTTVIFFLRRFGCQICRWAAVEVSKLEKDLRKRGVALIGVGPEETGLKEFMDGGFFKGGAFRPCSIHTWNYRVRNYRMSWIPGIILSPQVGLNSRSCLIARRTFVTGVIKLVQPFCFRQSSAIFQIHCCVSHCVLCWYFFFFQKYSSTKRSSATRT